jgi:hypothetical protein
MLNGPGFGVGLGLGLGLVDGETDGPPERATLPEGLTTIDPDARGDPATASWVGVAVPVNPVPNAVPMSVTVP